MWNSSEKLPIPFSLIILQNQENLEYTEGYYDGMVYRVLPGNKPVDNTKFIWAEVWNIQRQTGYPLDIFNNVICKFRLTENYADVRKEDAIKDTIKFLDNLDLAYEFNEYGGDDFNEFMKFIKDKYKDDPYVHLSVAMCGDVFNPMTKKDFVKYIYKRYRNIDLNGWI